ncbi:MAG: M15 family metallopeptidase [Deltaproteobacteria bacterium]
MNIDLKVLTGQTDENICWIENPKIGVHKEVLTSLQKLQIASQQAGFHLAICSGFRSFESQLLIWNAKASGKRSVLDSQSRPVDVSQLSLDQLMYAILRWSAFPGLSRHHWGTDFDVFDLKAMPQGYQLKLTSDEFEGAGYFAPMHDWLDQNLSRFGFFRPYAEDLGGVSPERWHISYNPIAEKYQAALTLDKIRKIISNTSMMLKSQVEKELPQIYERFFTRVSKS